MAKNSTEVQRQTGTACDLQFEHLSGVVVITAFRKWYVTMYCTNIEAAPLTNKAYLGVL